jgi:hypothetical protein
MSEAKKENSCEHIVNVNREILSTEHKTIIYMSRYTCVIYRSRSISVWRREKEKKDTEKEIRINKSTVPVTYILFLLILLLLIAEMRRIKSHPSSYFLISLISVQMTITSILTFLFLICHLNIISVFDSNKCIYINMTTSSICISTN